MAAKFFSKKEAISVGFKMTKKYFGVIFIVILIYAGYQIIQGLLSSGAGNVVTRESVKTLYAEPRAGNFYSYLTEAGYINNFGAVQDKLQNVRSAHDLALSENFEPDRQQIFEFLNEYRYRLPFPKIVYYLLVLALWVVGVIMQIGFVKIAITLARDRKPAVSELFTNGSLFFKFILASICYGLAVLGGFILLIVPGIIFAVALGLYSYLIVDKKMGPIQSLKASRGLTKSARWQLFVFGILLLLINIAGILCLFIGLLFTIPATSVAYAYVYDQLRKQEETAVAM